MTTETHTPMTTKATTPRTWLLEDALATWDRCGSWRALRAGDSLAQLQPHAYRLGEMYVNVLGVIDWVEGEDFGYGSPEGMPVSVDAETLRTWLAEIVEWSVQVADKAIDDAQRSVAESAERLAEAVAFRASLVA